MTMLHDGLRCGNVRRRRDRREAEDARAGYAARFWPMAVHGPQRPDMPFGVVWQSWCCQTGLNFRRLKKHQE
jgi:hypothetical protein